MTNRSYLQLTHVTVCNVKQETLEATSGTLLAAHKTPKGPRKFSTAVDVSSMAQSVLEDKQREQQVTTHSVLLHVLIIKAYARH